MKEETLIIGILKLQETYMLRLGIFCNYKVWGFYGDRLNRAALLDFIISLFSAINRYYKKELLPALNFKILNKLTSHSGNSPC